MPAFVEGMGGTRLHQATARANQSPSFPCVLSSKSSSKHALVKETPLEALLLDLGLGIGDRSVGVGVDEAAAELAVLGGGSLGGADSEPGGGDLGAAGGLAVGVVDAAAGDELGAVAGTDTLGAGVVGGQGEGRDGDCGGRRG